MSERDKWQAASERLAHYTEPKSDAQYRRDRALAARAAALMASAPDADWLEETTDAAEDLQGVVHLEAVTAWLRSVAALLREEEGTE